MSRDDQPERLFWLLLDLLAEMEERDPRDELPGSVDPLPDEGPPDDLPDAVGTSPVTRRETDDGVLVVADIPGVTEGDVQTYLDHGSDALVLQAGDTVVDRVPLDGGEWTITDVSLNNGVFEVALVSG